MYRILVALLFLAGIAGFPMGTVFGAEGFGDKPIRWVVPYAPGGGVDVLTRALAREVSQDLNVTVIVQNIPGGGARIGTSYVYRGKPDGHTLGTFVNGSLIIPQILFDDAPYDVRKLVWIASPFPPPSGSGSSHNLRSAPSQTSRSWAAPCGSEKAASRRLRFRPPSFSCGRWASTTST